MGLSPETLRTPERPPRIFLRPDRDHETTLQPHRRLRPLLPAALLVASCFGIGGVALASVAPAIDAVTAQDGSKQKDADAKKQDDASAKKKSEADKKEEP